MLVRSTLDETARNLIQKTRKLNTKKSEEKKGKFSKDKHNIYNKKF